MPTLTLALDHFGRPVIELYVGVSAAEQEALGTSEQLPPPVRVRALVDTGASRTVVEQRRLEVLKVSPTGTTQFHSSTTGGEAVTAREYAVSVALAGETTGVLAEDLEVVAAEDLSGIDVEVLLGRDVLRLCVLLYDGPKQKITLAFPPLEEP